MLRFNPWYARKTGARAWHCVSAAALPLLLSEARSCAPPWCLMSIDSVGLFMRRENSTLTDLPASDGGDLLSLGRRALALRYSLLCVIAPNLPGCLQCPARMLVSWRPWKTRVLTCRQSETVTCPGGRSIPPLTHGLSPRALTQFCCGSRAWERAAIKGQTSTNLAPGMCEEL